MKVLLVGPNQEENLSLRYLSSSLKSAGHEVTLAAFNTDKDTDEVLAAAKSAKLVGLSMCFQARADEFLSLAASIKGVGPKAPIVVGGGHHASTEAQSLLQNHPALDAIAVHEAEQTLVEIAECVKGGRDFSSVRGVVHRGKDNKIVFTEKRRIEEDLDRLPFPDRTGPPALLAGVPTAYLMGSRGCLWSCGYCAITTLHRQPKGGAFDNGRLRRLPRRWRSSIEPGGFCSSSSTMTIFSCRMWRPITVGSRHWNSSLDKETSTTSLSS